MPEAVVLAEVLAMIGGDHDPGLRQVARVAQVAKEASELGIQGEEAIVVEIAQAAPGRLQFPLALRPLLRLGRVPCLQGLPAATGSGELRGRCARC